jgi:cleavage stimulation factor subunit 3
MTDSQVEPADTQNESSNEIEKIPEETGNDIETPAQGIDEPNLWNKVPSQILKHLQAQIEKNIWDSDAREKLIKECLRSNDTELIRKAFSDYLTQFPTCVKIWVQWIEFERDALNYDQLEKIFEKCIRFVPSVELYENYMEYIRHIHSLDSETATEEQVRQARQTVIQAFEFALNTVGTDKESGGLWMDYIKFIQSGQTTSNFEEQQKMDHLRKVFHKAIYTPIHNIEEVWKEYDTFENTLSKITVSIEIHSGQKVYIRSCRWIHDCSRCHEGFEEFAGSNRKNIQILGG